MGDKLTEANIYEPTVAEEKLLAVLLNPEYIHQTVVEKCKAADISRVTYYEAMKKPGFLKKVQGFRETALQAEVQDLIQVGIKEAKNGSFQHWKVLMEMAGEYAPKTKGEFTANIKQETIDKDISDDELQARIAKLGSQV